VLCMLCHMFVLMCWVAFLSLFFFQAEDGIRDWSVTGVQTCALPIFSCCRWRPYCSKRPSFQSVSALLAAQPDLFDRPRLAGLTQGDAIVTPGEEQALIAAIEIGRASCRERGRGTGVGGACKGTR